MKPVIYDVGHMPTWAIPYIENGDAENLSDAEMETINAWLSSLPENAVIAIKYDEHPEFTTWPAFGLSCDCMPYKVTTWTADDAENDDSNDNDGEYCRDYESYSDADLGL